jgi:1-acyl-sn-glycerol-3-phosphate acyltransferase
MGPASDAQNPAPDAQAPAPVAQAHRIARERGVSRVLYALVRFLVVPFMRLWFGVRITGAEHVPGTGAAIVTPNHKSFWDAFFIAAATGRHVRFMGKAELFRGPWARLLLRLGAFPVRRGEADQEALETARTILRQGGLLALFPEGTRVRDPAALGSPRRGAARLALETGAPLIPAAITGTERLFIGPFPRPVRVRVSFGEPIPVADLEPSAETAGRLVEEALWPRVEREFELLLSRPGVVAAALAALGVGVALRRRGGSRGGGRLSPKPRRRRARGRRAR